MDFCYRAACDIPQTYQDAVMSNMLKNVENVEKCHEQGDEITGGESDLQSHPVATRQTGSGGQMGLGT